MFGEHFLEADDAFHTHQRIQFLAGVGKVLAQALVHGHATGDQFVFEHLLEQGATTTAAGASLGLRLEHRQVAAAVVDGRADGALGDVVARANGRRLGQGIGAQARRTVGHRQDQ
ncbi:hypothetical protein D3C84_164770 [compost metagenome]